MNDPDNFLSRWSRRKREAGESKEKKEEATGEARAESAPENETDEMASAPAPSPEFDPASLPPIESISAGTDITAFMRAGVPETLKHAALRRAWASDPGVRNFVGLNENFWDAAGPDGIAGFGDIGPNLDVRRMVSELFGETPRQNTPSEPEADRVADSSVLPVQNQPQEAGSPDAISPPAEPVPEREENAAVQIEPPESAPEKKFARRHGGAMPQ